jgi:hypothetical protein
MMRYLLTVLAVVALAPAARADSFEMPLVGREREAHGREMVPMVPRKTAPNRIMGRKTNVSGAFVTVAKARHPIQAINPGAPAKYGDGYANVARDPVTGQADGIILLAIEF